MSQPAPSTGEPTRIAVVGLGYWGPNLVRNLYEIAETELTWVCDLRPERLEAIGRRYPAVKRTTNLDEILADPDVDAVAIATNVSSHHALAKRALEAGKHVFVEKPLAASVEEAQDLIAAADARKLVLMPGHTFLYSPPVNVIKGLIDAGDLGDIYFITTSRVNLGLHQPDVSVVWDLAPHDFSILRYWLDETPVSAAALSRGCIVPGTPDVAFINLEYCTGAIAHVELSWLAPSKLRRTAIVGSRKMVVYDDTSSEPVRIFDSGVDLQEPETYGEYKLTYRTGDIISPKVAASEPLALELRDFHDAISEGRTPRSSAAVGLDVVRMMEAVDRSLAAGGGPVETGARSATGPALTGR
jgi:predicted dehydrogenase